MNDNVNEDKTQQDLIDVKINRLYGDRTSTAVEKNTLTDEEKRNALVMHFNDKPNNHALILYKSALVIILSLVILRASSIL